MEAKRTNLTSDLAIARQRKLFQDLRDRNERLARPDEIQRRARIERVIQAARQRRFGRAG